MIQKETIIINNKKFKRTYSDEGYYIQKVGTQEIYSEAVDIPTVNYEYIETDKKIKEDSESEELNENN